MASLIRRSMKVTPVNPVDTSTQYQDYLKNRKPGSTPEKKKPGCNGLNFKEMVLKEINKK